MEFLPLAAQQRAVRRVLQQRMLELITSASGACR
jgi:hypothetical protein